MDPSSPENLPSTQRRAIGELIRGRELARQLKIVLNSRDDMEEHVPVDDLVMKILNSFTNSLSILNRFDSDIEFPPSTHVGSPCWDSGRKSEDSGESIRSTSTNKDRRGCYKRRKISNALIRETSDLIDDGHAWRKYGQKVILNTKFPRNYFRCTHKYDQGCQATKQVQKIEEDPPKYRTTYYGNHTCKNLLKASHHLILESPDDSSILLSFNTTNDSIITSKQDSPFLTSFSSSSSIKQEYKDELAHGNSDNDMINIIHNNSIMNNQSSSTDYLLAPDDLSALDHADVISGVNSSSCTTSTHSFDMDMIVSSVGHACFAADDDDVLPYAF
ncbi:WRKY DNA-binding transcription factor 70 [Ricinus communis]|uniref:WRKY transcription factor, putative n=1 Tax=Ricinus communis TaxID=3988 RepID=B9SRT4_RICCO|nr:WRKY DNA-binding transcription factor 70 [Ricinus communis]EEF33686.1 WRKY transcription factor, putative [Ricinus communis]|eukprot:XP_002528697.1 probable WRKY transcription factor 70 [Ricinus communis]